MLCLEKLFFDLLLHAILFPFFFVVIGYEPMARVEPFRGLFVWLDRASERLRPGTIARLGALSHLRG